MSSVTPPHDDDQEACCVYCQHFQSKDWSSALFALKEKDIKIGQRLGLPFTRSMLPTLDVQVGSETLSLAQDGAGVMAISGVVWDCGLLLVDFLHLFVASKNRFLCKKHDNIKLNTVLDIGCGTGIGGIAALHLGVPQVVFTDMCQTNSLESNLEHFASASSFIAHAWNAESIPSELADVSWDVLLCSDLLYDAKHHAALLHFLQQLVFQQAIFAYKLRHDQAEYAFFEALSTWCEIEVVDTDLLPHINLSAQALQGTGLYLVVATPKKKT